MCNMKVFAISSLVTLIFSDPLFTLIALATVILNGSSNNAKVLKLFSEKNYISVNFFFI